MFVGGAPTALVVWFMVFLPIRRVVANYQHHRRLRRIKRRKFLDQRKQDQANRSDPAGTDDTAQAGPQIDTPEPDELRVANQSSGNVTQLRPKQ